MLHHAYHILPTLHAGVPTLQPVTSIDAVQTTAMILAGITRVDCIDIDVNRDSRRLMAASRWNPMLSGSHECGLDRESSRAQYIQSLDRQNKGTDMREMRIELA
jgi:hypothetical protein